MVVHIRHGVGECETCTGRACMYVWVGVCVFFFGGGDDE